MTASYSKMPSVRVSAPPLLVLARRIYLNWREVCFAETRSPIQGDGVRRSALEHSIPGVRRSQACLAYVLFEPEPSKSRFATAQLRLRKVRGNCESVQLAIKTMRGRPQLLRSDGVEP